MRQFKNKSMLQLKGFDEFLDALKVAGKSCDNEGRKCFEKCTENLYDELYTKAKKAGLPEHLLSEIHEDTFESPNIWYYSVGWKKEKPNPYYLPDVYKVLFFNYGTPMRQTKEGYNRGKEKKKKFIKKAKLAAARKNKKVMNDTLNRILGELK